MEINKSWYQYLHVSAIYQYFNRSKKPRAQAAIATLKQMVSLNLQVSKLSRSTCSHLSQKSVGYKKYSFYGFPKRLFQLHLQQKYKLQIFSRVFRRVFYLPTLRIDSKVFAEALPGVLKNFQGFLPLRSFGASTAHATHRHRRGLMIWVPFRSQKVFRNPRP